MDSVSWKGFESQKYFDRLIFANEYICAIQVYTPRRILKTPFVWFDFSKKALNLEHHKILSPWKFI